MLRLKGGTKMAYEIKDWKRSDCSLTLRVAQFSDRDTFSKEINEKFGEGGGLNANYKTVEAIAKAANLLGKAGLEYGKDFIFKTSLFADEMSFDFSDPTTKGQAEKILTNFDKINPS